MSKEEIAVMDTVDHRKTAEWMDNLKKELAGKTPDYLVISHLEPDHGKDVVERRSYYNKGGMSCAAGVFIAEGKRKIFS